jgi:Secretion system C-terminal sorting domain
MKKLIFTLLTFCAIYVQTNAQYVNAYCGNSGPNVCNAANDTINKPGLAPLADSLAPVYLGENVSETIQFENYDTTSFAGSVVTIDSLQIDTIGNLPGGLCWATNKSNNRFANKEKGCINVSGTVSSTDPCGQYQLYIVVDVWVHGIGDLTLNAAQEALYYYVRVNGNMNDTAVPIDTAGQAAQTNHFVAYASCVSAIKELSISYMNNLSIVPNPMNDQSTVQFTSAKATTVTERITNVVGSEVYSNELNVNVGVNTHTINKNNLAAGVYIYSLTDGQSVYSKKLVISE